MTQITEDYVSFETAKLLKEKEFNGFVKSYYGETGLEGYMMGIGITNNLLLASYFYARPTLQMAMKWLREAHHCVVCITPLTFHCDGIVSKWGYCIWADDNTEVDEDNTPEFDTYEEACEAAIKYCLENLI